MKRKIYDYLLQWKEKADRKPLIVNGARQVGKTYILQEFGQQEYDNYVIVNLETDKALVEKFEESITPRSLIQYLESAHSQRIIPGKTLIVIDEIQASERALTSLKYFYEQAPEFHVVAAGSLLGVAINRKQFSFPVGKVDEITLFPMDFEEFLWANNRSMLAHTIREHYLSNEPLDVHSIAVDLYNKYLIVGGMPAAVKEFIATDSFVAIADMQNRILNEYIADMAKYAEPATSIKIRACYESIPAQLAKENRKFQYSVVQRGGSSTIFGESIEWLKYAGVILKCQKTTQGTMPVKVYVDLSDFKLYMADVGMLTMQSGIATQAILSPLDIENPFLGAIAENYVAQALANNLITLLYWKNDNTAEVDFVIQKDTDVIPIEVKSGLRIRSKSLRIFMEKYNCPYGIRISKKNFGFENSIKSVPLYAAFCI
ncbi:MAG: ATPase [Bacteroidetes bacterium GWD2_45_23]|nr:MAG: ATPase [Bacteroidetes bacterium GWC2_46_850]OFX82574.1 MAG: ATPase [Bacteroidetes bacterium GWD2_45_23]HBB01197.1 ATPase [Porphyromonadaceae bacterium]HCC18672.1 ATPase [Porphyromonadaceae bacterium]